MLTQKIERKGILPNAFDEVTAILITNSNTRHEKHTHQVPLEYLCKNSQNNTAKLNSAAYS